MKKNHSLLKSFADAFRGIGHVIAGERNMRIHTVAALYVFVFSLFYRLSGTQYALLLLTFGAVIALECVNTAIERLADSVTEEKNEKIRRAKDAAAGAVLVNALFSVGIGFFLFWDTRVFSEIYRYFAERSYLIFVLAGSVILAVLYIIWPFGRRKNGK